MMGETTRKREAFAAATRRFPHFELSIKRLIETDENFRDICEEFAEAEVALAAVGSTPAHVREARRTEWRDLVDRLAGEIDAAIRSDAFARDARTQRNASQADVDRTRIARAGTMKRR